MASRRARSAAFTSTVIPVRIPQTRMTATTRESSLGLFRQILSTSGPRSGQLGQQHSAGYSLLADSPTVQNAGPYQVTSRGPATRFRARRIAANERLAC